MDFILTLHGAMRWLVLVLAFLAVVKFGWGWLRRREYASLDRGLMLAYTITLDLNLLLGLILLLALGGGFPHARVEHAVTMLFAILVAHTNAAWRHSSSAPRKFRNNLLAVIISLAVVVVAVFRLRGGWMWG